MLKAHRILVFSPHPDDEVIGCGGTLALARDDGAKVRVIVITDGEKGIPKNQFPQIRRKECIAGLEMLGIKDVHFWGYPDQAIPLSGSIIEKYRNVVSEFKPQYIFLPSPSDSHPDHRRVTRGILKALKGHWDGKLFFYETTQPVLINTAKDITSVIELKRLALLANASQMEQFNYEDLCLSLARLRALPIGVEYAEGFLNYDWDGSIQNFFETRPLISVIVRADNLLHLRNALKSLIEQKYDQMEVILVWHGHEKIDLSEFEYLDIQLVNSEGGRGRNLNLGLSYAQGEYVAFLDQDDIVYPEHFEILISQLNGNNEYDIAYSGCKICHTEISDNERHILREGTTLNRSYHQGRLILGNYIPIHALLARNIVFRDQKFDENLVAYEDWEMLARLEMSGYRFLHVDSITCEYHLFGHGDFTMEQIHKSKGYLSQRDVVLSKIFKQLTLQNFKHLSQLILTNESKIYEMERIVEEQKVKLGKNQKKLNENKSIEEFLSQGMAAVHIHTPGQKGVAEMLGRLFSGIDLFSIIIPVYNTPADILQETLLSVTNQIYTGWELCLVDDASDQEDTLKLLSSLPERNSFQGRLRYSKRKERGGIAAALNDAVSLSQMPYLVFLDHDDMLHEEALLRLALVILSEKEYSLLYTDSRTVDLTGRPIHIYHKPRWSPENLLHGNYINHLTVVRRDIFEQVGGFRKEYEGLQDLDLLLRLSLSLKDEDIRHINIPLYDWRAATNSVAYSGTTKPYAFESGRRAIADYLRQKGFSNIVVENNPHGIGFFCDWENRGDEINIIIPTRDNLSGLKMCIEGLLEETDYPCFSITVVSSNSSSQMMVKYLDSLREKERINVIIDNRSFNWSALNNRAIDEISAPILLFMSDYIDIIDPKWLRNMSKYLMLDGVGAVGAALFYPNGSLQHNGIITDEKFVAANITTWGKKKELTTTRNVSAVTGDCLLLKRQTLESLGGFNEELPHFFNNVDLCLNIRSKGLRIVQATDVQLIHHESATRGYLNSLEMKEEWQNSSVFMRNKWGSYLKEKYVASYELFAQFTKILHIT